MSQLGDVRVISVAATRAFDATRDCIIRNNRISNVDSEKGNIVIGVDIQGETIGIDLSHNKVDLRRRTRKGAAEEPEKYIGLRVREHVDGSSIDIAENNKFKDGIQNLAPERRLRKVFNGAPHGHIEGTEWENGGCPFARKPGKKRQ